MTENKVPQEKKTFQSKEEITCEVRKKLGVLSENMKGYTTEVNIISWNSYPPKLDIRQWTPEAHRPMKGLTLSEREARRLYDALKDCFENGKEVTDAENPWLF